MVKKLPLLFFFLYTTITYAATIKTDVLVIGSGASATAAAIQSARSRLKTVLLVKGDWLEDAKQRQIIADQYYNRPFQKPDSSSFYFMANRDSLKTALSHNDYVNYLSNDLKKKADTIKLLSIKLHTTYTDIEKDGTGWKATVIINGEKVTVKAKALIDATPNGEIVTKVEASFPPAYTEWRKTAGQYLYRTSIAGGTTNEKAAGLYDNYPQSPAFYIPLSAVIAKNATNLFVVDKALAIGDDQYLPAEVTLAEGVGASAAFCAFFKLTTQNLRVRAIQIELLDFAGHAMPFNDIDQKDPYSRAIQQIGLTGMLKGVLRENEAGKEFLFMPDALVKTEEIKPVLTEIYSRAFLWLNREKPAEDFTTGNLLSLISEITLSEPKDFQIYMQHAWKNDFKFTSDFDLQRPVTRREFAILANKYLNPFARTVDMAGRIVN